MRTNANRARRAPKAPNVPKPPSPPEVKAPVSATPKPPSPHRRRREAIQTGQDIERRAIREQDHKAYDVPDDVLSSLLVERIMGQHPNLRDDDYEAFWIRNFQLEPNDDDRAAVEHVTKLIEEGK